MSKADAYRRELGHQLAERLSEGFKFYPSKRELRRRSGYGNDVVILAGSSQWSPCISIDFYMGRSFDQVRTIEKLTGDDRVPYHIQQYSPNVSRMSGLQYDGPSSWEVDLRSPDVRLASELQLAIEQVAFPFFDRFATLRSARDAIASGDSWCFEAKGPMWHHLLKLDAALGELAHFKKWMRCLEKFYLDQATEGVRKYEAVLGQS